MAIPASSSNSCENRLHSSARRFLFVSWRCPDLSVCNSRMSACSRGGLSATTGAPTFDLTSRVLTYTGQRSSRAARATGSQCPRRSTEISPGHFVCAKAPRRTFLVARFTALGAAYRARYSPSPTRYGTPSQDELTHVQTHRWKLGVRLHEPTGQRGKRAVILHDPSSAKAIGSTRRKVPH